MKSIVIGSSLSGKTTLVRYLRSHTKMNVKEMDEMLTELNDGNFPQNLKHKEALASKVIQNVLNQENIIFFTNTDYFSQEDLRLAKTLGFKIIQLNISLRKLKIRNTQRIENEKYDDMTPYLTGMLNYQKEISKSGLIDKVIIADQPAELLAKSLLDYLGSC